MMLLCTLHRSTAITDLMPYAINTKLHFENNYISAKMSQNNKFHSFIFPTNLDEFKTYLQIFFFNDFNIFLVVSCPAVSFRPFLSMSSPCPCPVD